jgi:hypothetical protein
MRRPRSGNIDRRLVDLERRGVEPTAHPARRHAEAVARADERLRAMLKAAGPFGPPTTAERAEGAALLAKLRAEVRGS